MARRVAWHVGVEGVPRESIVAFTFTERAAEEMKFRIRKWMEVALPSDDDVTLGGMYVGTIHGYCLKLLRKLRPDDYHNFDIVDEPARVALVQRRYHDLLGLAHLQSVLGTGQYATMDAFLKAYDLLNEYNELDVQLASDTAPHDPAHEADWCKQASLRTAVGRSSKAQAFALAAGRYYAYLRCRRFLDFSTSQSELLRLLASDAVALGELRDSVTHLVVDEAQDLNPVQDQLVRTIIGDAGTLTAVGDHRQAIFHWRGGRVDLMGKLYEEIDNAPDGEVIDLPQNFRSTKRIIDLANEWARTIGAVGSMSSPDMKAGNTKRSDLSTTHTAALSFDEREEEAEWIADSVDRLVRRDGRGAFHDTEDGSRGLSYTDVAVLIRSSTDARKYMSALEAKGIPAVFRAGPDLFSQPEVLLFLAVLAHGAGIDAFVGSPHDSKSLPNRVAEVLNCGPEPSSVIRAACTALRTAGLPLDPDTEDRLSLAANLARQRIEGSKTISEPDVRPLHSDRLRRWLRDTRTVRRVFPQALFHLFLEEAGVRTWDSPARPRGASAMFHLGQLSTLVMGIETPGWTSAQEFKYQVIALCLWGTQNARTAEAPLLVPPDAVTISTIHAAKGLEYAAVFLADVCARRFPNQLARHREPLPFEGPLGQRIDPAYLADNDNYDGERRLMYVALTRAERYLFVTCSGRQRSQFFRTVEQVVGRVGGTTGAPPASVPATLRYEKSEPRREDRLVTSFSDLRYYLECPHDFYLRKVLGFAPTIDQAFGYGRGVHNLLRAVHSDPGTFAGLADDRAALRARLEDLVHRGLLYLRHTTGEPADNMRQRALAIVQDYIAIYSGELLRLTFEAEREFETLIGEEQVLVSGAIDVVRLDDPPRVTIIDFKSGDAESDKRMKLDEGEMRLQVGLYALAAKRELEYEPQNGLVRYLGESDPAKRELSIPMDSAALQDARRLVAETARAIRHRRFDAGPRTQPNAQDPRTRCSRCDFGGFCGLCV
jgi:DNA helicase-2/ATP-dependent DNA helicase PcrA